MSDLTLNIEDFSSNKPFCLECDGEGWIEHHIQEAGEIKTVSTRCWNKVHQKQVEE